MKYLIVSLLLYTYNILVLILDYILIQLIDHHHHPKKIILPKKMVLLFDDDCINLTELEIH